MPWVSYKKKNATARPPTMETSKLATFEAAPLWTTVAVALEAVVLLPLAKPVLAATVFVWLDEVATAVARVVAAEAVEL